jgi:hypothetical protein
VASPPQYWLVNAAGAGARVDLGGATFNPTPSDAGFNRRNLALTEEVELSGDGAFAFQVHLLPTHGSVTGIPSLAQPTMLEVQGQSPSPSRGGARLALSMPRAGRVRWELLDIGGRRVSGQDLGWREAGRHEIMWSDRGDRGSALPAGLYLVSIEAAGERQTLRWILLR